MKRFPQQNLVKMNESMNLMFLNVVQNVPVEFESV